MVSTTGTLHFHDPVPYCVIECSVYICIIWFCLIWTKTVLKPLTWWTYSCNSITLSRRGILIWSSQLVCIFNTQQRLSVLIEYLLNWSSSNTLRADHVYSKRCMPFKHRDQRPWFRLRRRSWYVCCNWYM